MFPFSLINRARLYLYPSQAPNKNAESPKLPSDIIFNVIDELAASGDSRTLATVSLLSTTFRDYAQTRVFGSVSITSRETLFSFQDSIKPSSARGSRLASKVKALAVVLDYDDPFHITEDHFVSLVRACPSLRSLSVSIQGCKDPICAAPLVDQQQRPKGCPAPSFNRSTIAQLRRLAPHVSHLEMTNWSDNGDMSIQLLEALPSLKSVVLRGTIPQTLPAVHQADAPCSLDSLAFELSVQPTSDVVQWLIGRYATDLLTLSFGFEPSSALLETALAQCTSTLQTLSLPSCPPLRDNLLHDCAELTSLEIQSFSTTSSTLDNLPKSLRRVLLGVSDLLFDPESFEFLRQLPRLTTVSLSFLRAIDGQRVVRDVVRARGIGCEVFL
ncbi:hypothetical protein SISNIDRAFT_466403 [Sistotremastrum niveocremeum HHB9708]|uniref:F-box domain-containing protein n=1 Tax=Sistotremastrum niveocremeum HHB9708 TaxID=1314777 RepID=A0A164U9J7_9AGAM|nr:hypothetical protein SISNIDRAFT_466403 [Sistotremastrum niveocremeum HHB9708]